MKPTKAKSGKFKIAYLTLILAALLCGGGYGWHVYSLFRDAQLNMPQPQIEKLRKDLRTFHSRTKRFPNNFNEINDLLWRTQPKPDYGAEGRQARVKNYYYFYTRVHDNQCALWAIPLGPRREYASTYFLVIFDSGVRIWKGKAITDEGIARLPSIPTTNALTTLGLQEQPN